MLDKTIIIRLINESDKDWISPFLMEHWSSTRMVSRGRMYSVDENPGFVAIKDDQSIGLIPYELLGEECEITTLNSLEESKGIGTALIDAVKEAAIQAGSKRLLVITTNDNTHAIRFYQRRGFTIATIYPN